MRSKFGIVVITLIALVLVSCGGGGSSSPSPGSPNPTASLTSITVSGPSSITFGGTPQQFSATGHYSDGTSKALSSNLTWASSATNVATVSNTGVVTPVKSGNTTISATAKSIRGSSALTVTALLSSITVTPANPGVFVGSTLKLAATGTFNDGTTQNLSNTVMWSTSDAAKATVSSTGLVTGLKGGSVTITAASGAISKGASLAVTALLKTLNLSPIGFGAAVGDTKQYSATGSFNDGTTNDLSSSVTWSTSDLSKASINGAGLATAVAPGGVSINASGTSADGTVVSASTALDIVTPPATQPNLNGTYAFTLMSADSRGPRFYAGSFTADGSGNITTGQEDSNTAEGVHTQIGVSGTYQVFADGRGDIVFNSNAIHPTGLTLRFVLSSNNTQGMLIEFDGNGTTRGTLELQNSAAFTSSALLGQYVFRISGIDDSAHPLGQIGLFISNGSGTIGGGTIDTNDFGTLTAAEALTQTSYSVDASGRGTIQLGSGGGIRNFAFYIINSNKINLIQTDNSIQAAAGVAELQQNQTYTNASVTGGYAFLLEHVVFMSSKPSEDRGEFNKIGRFTFDGVGSVAAIQDECNNKNNNPLNNITGAYSIGGLGIQGRGTLIETTAFGNENFVFYLVSPSKMYVLHTFLGANNASVNAPVGVALQQSGAGSFTQATLNGSFAGFASQLTTTYLEVLMRAQFDGAGGIDGIEDSSKLGVIASTVPGASYSSTPGNNPDPASGRGTMHMANGAGLNDYTFYLISPQSSFIAGVLPATDGVIALQ